MPGNARSAQQWCFKGVPPGHFPFDQKMQFLAPWGDYWAAQRIPVVQSKLPHRLRIIPASVHCMWRGCAARSPRLLPSNSCSAVQPFRIVCTASQRATPPAGMAGEAVAPGGALPVAQRKLKILCLHGYLQNAAVFRSRIGSLRKGLKSRAEFFFVDAPYLVEAADDAETAESDGGGSAGAGRSWW